MANVVNDGPTSYGTATIANGQQLSDAVDLQGSRLMAVLLPASLTGTALTFEVSHDGTNFAPLYKTDGDAVSYTVATSRYVLVEYEHFAAFRFVKVKSGSAEGGARSVVLLGLPS